MAKIVHAWEVPGAASYTRQKTTAESPSGRSPSSAKFGNRKERGEAEPINIPSPVAGSPTSRKDHPLSPTSSPNTKQFNQYSRSAPHSRHGRGGGGRSSFDHAGASPLQLSAASDITPTIPQPKPMSPNQSDAKRRSQQLKPPQTNIECAMSTSPSESALRTIQPTKEGGIQIKLNNQPQQPQPQQPQSAADDSKVVRKIQQTKDGGLQIKLMATQPHTKIRRNRQPSEELPSQKVPEPKSEQKEETVEAPKWQQKSDHHHSPKMGRGAESASSSPRRQNRHSTPPSTSPARFAPGSPPRDQRSPFQGKFVTGSPPRELFDIRGQAARSPPRENGPFPTKVAADSPPRDSFARSPPSAQSIPPKVRESPGKAALSQEPSKIPEVTKAPEIAFDEIEKVECWADEIVEEEVTEVKALAFEDIESVSCWADEV
ncbi:hypothetical protein HDU97_008228 [Phlyctochytrium planicorne]|nr:hypothetical protein HDU97_008228 [Phlyctochytrium planicorne]